MIFGIVHPKNENVLTFTHPEVVMNPYEFCYSVEHKIYVGESLKPLTTDIFSRKNNSFIFFSA